MGATRARKMMKKILIYNWIPFDEIENKGGGVTVYTRSLIEELVKDSSLKIFFLSSGRAYDRKNKRIRIEKRDSILGEKCESYQIVNSPIFSSARISFPFIEKYLNDVALLDVISSFIVKCGGFDVVHFQNFEGLSLSVFKIKQRFPQMKVFFSVHNYYLFCPEVMLWYADKENCQKKECGKWCLECMERNIHYKKIVYNQSIVYEQEKRGSRVLSPIILSMQKFNELKYAFYDKYLCRELSEDQVQVFAKNCSEFRKRNIEYVNRYVDKVIVVSGRVNEIALKMGINREKILISYIGTKAADYQIGHLAFKYDGIAFRICYLGKMKSMKGFYFLLDALEKMPEDISGKIEVIIAAKNEDNEAVKRINNLKKKYIRVRWYDGYKYEQLTEILHGVQLGIVPVLWEDNLPQVAIEMKANGIPVLASNLGGASELSVSDEFVFTAGKTDEFLSKLKWFVDNPDMLNRYWMDNKKLLTMKEHVEELKKIWKT